MIALAERIGSGLAWATDHAVEIIAALAAWTCVAAWLAMGQPDD